ncbi:conserved hypothetical protein [Candidatus Magnetomoraceae bacterium gMMP-13]
MMQKNLSNWLPTYITNSIGDFFKNKSNSLKHIMFLFVDHFELAGKEPRLKEWMSKYPKLASKHQDSYGIPPKHTWFYALDLMREAELEQLKKLCIKGLGEVELHWHHGYDTSESFQKKLLNGLTLFQKYGFMCSQSESKPGSFAFIHGNWSLDNACGDEFCGVNNEIELLKQAGCYGDFTFPALHSVAQPSMINSIYYAVDNGKPKSYNQGRLSQVGTKENNNELMIFEGPLLINWHDWRFKWHPTIENGEIGRSCSHYDPKRIDSWIRQGIHVKGCPEWIFVKVFCHGGQDYKAVLSEATDNMFSYLETKYNDGIRYCLHYVTAREAYNIVKAAEDGKKGNPDQFRDYVIPNPLKLG